MKTSLESRNLVVDACDGTFSMNKTCIVLPERRNFVADGNCLTEGASQLILFYARQMQCKTPDIDEEEDVRRSAEIGLRAVEALDMRMRLDGWEVLEGLPPMETLPSQILYHLSTYFGEEELLQKARNIPGSQLSEKWRARLTMFDIGLMLAVDREGSRIFLKKSAIPHRHSGQGVFAGVQSALKRW